MAHKIALSLFLLSVLKVVVSQDNCNANEYLTQTVNPCNTCDTRGWCPENYGVACDCIPGFFRNSQGMCVPPEACDRPYGTPYGRDVPPPATCRDPNEEYTDCGSACAPTCEENSGRVCPAVCVPGCFCRRGYVKNSQGICVRPDQCKREAYNCGENEEFQSCGTSCPATCENPRPNSGVCIQRCVTGCFCTTGYVRKGKKCVRESECNAPSNVGPRSYYVPGPYRPPPRPVTNPPVVRPSPTPSSYPAPVPPAYPPPIRPVRPPQPPPADSKGCPNRNLCNRNCKAEGLAVGFCVGDRFLKCNCMG